MITTTCEVDSAIDIDNSLGETLTRITVKRIDRMMAKLVFVSPPEVMILREELWSDFLGGKFRGVANSGGGLILSRRVGQTILVIVGLAIHARVKLLSTLRREARFGIIRNPLTGAAPLTTPTTTTT